MLVQEELINRGGEKREKGKRLQPRVLRSQLCCGHRAVVSEPTEISACIFRSSGSAKDAFQGSIKARSWNLSTLFVQRAFRMA